MAPLPPRKTLARHLTLALRIASFIPIALWLLSHAYWLLFACLDSGRDELCEAAYYGRLGDIRLLLAMGANPSRVGWEYHFTPLTMAMQGGQAEAARLLLAAGADPNTPNDSGRTALASGGVWGAADTASKERVAELIHQAGGHL